MKVAVLGGGPAGLFFALLLKRADTRHEITVYERNRPDETWGFGVVFSDATEDALAVADPAVTAQMAKHAHRWDDIEIHYRGEVLTSTGHGFSGLSRRTLLGILGDRCRELGVATCYEHVVTDFERLREADLVLAADGLNSEVREHWRQRFRPELDVRPNRFVWLGTTRPFPAFTFYFIETEHGLWRVHAYQYEPERSTFIVEARDETWRAAGLEQADETRTLAFCERLFERRLEGHRLVSNRSIWRAFPTLRCGTWHHENVALIGDAAHTAHFSVGSGTKLAMEDAIALADALRRHASVPDALADYEAARRPPVESLQRAAQASLQWFEDTERYMSLEPIQFAFTLLTRSLRVTHQNLKLRDPAFVERVDRWFEAQAETRVGRDAATQVRQPLTRPATGPAPPMFAPFRLRELLLANRVVVSPMCQYSCTDGTVGDWHLVHLGARAVG
ncbi:MAG TPA: FAD-dependent monooxygenase, partial [Dongiaceae bacterium]|nr:FAD-dependent monooxygenase [Dongiaceae bacterium]